MTAQNAQPPPDPTQTPGPTSSSIQTNELADYLSTRRAEATTRSYRQVLNKLPVHPDEFLEIARRDRLKAEQMVTNAIIEQRNRRLKGASIQVFLSVVRSFCDFYEVSLNWKKLKGIVPPAVHVARDRAPTHAEVRRLLEIAPTRDRVAILFMASCGMRIGALVTLKVGDVNILEEGMAEVTVYRGEPEEYKTFISREAVRALGAYLDERKRAGEVVTPESPLIRDRWDLWQRGKPSVARPLNRNSMGTQIGRLWNRCGIRPISPGDTPALGPSKRYEFKADHGFRKFFRTNLPFCDEHGRDDAEVLMGHYLSYHKPTYEHLKALYLRGEGSVTMSETDQVKAKLARTEGEMAAKIAALEKTISEMARYLEAIKTGVLTDVEQVPTAVERRPSSP